MKKIYKLTVEPITPVHIGTGEVLTPLDYKIISHKGNKFFLRFSSDSVLSRIATDEKLSSEFNRVVAENNMKLVQDFFHKNCVTNDDGQYICLATKEFLNRYELNRQKDPLQNASEVFETFRNEGSAHPVISGSSLKGSIRTAVLQYFLNQINDSEYQKLDDEFYNIRDNWQKAKFDSKLQKYVLENIASKDSAKTDPFRSIEISDCDFAGIEAQIVGLIKNISSKNGNITEIEKLQIQTEAINGSLIGNTKKAEAILRINEDLQNAKGVSKKISINDIIEACNDFYLNQFENEYSKFYKDAYDKVDLILELTKILKSTTKENNTFVLRVGRWSQLEFVTFEKNFRAYFDNRKKQVIDEGNTRSVFNFDGQYLPMGWCKCTVEEVKN